MGIGALNYQGVKGGLKLNDVIEEFKYVYKNKTIKAGDFVNYINGVGSSISATDVSTYISYYRADAVQLDENRVAVIYFSSTNLVCCKIITIKDLQFSIGTEYSVTLSNSFTGYICATLIDTNKILICFNMHVSSQGIPCAIVATIADTVASFGSIVQSTSNSDYYFMDVCKVDTNKAVGGLYFTGNDSRCSNWVITVSGTTPSLSATLAVLNYYGTSYITLSQLDTNKFLMSWYKSDGNDAMIDIGTVSGTSVSHNVKNVSEGSKDTMYNSCVINSSKFVFFHYSNTYSKSYVSVSTISGSDITTTDVEVSWNFFTSIWSMALDDSRIVFAFSDSANSSLVTYVIATIDGSSISFGTAFVTSYTRRFFKWLGSLIEGQLLALYADSNGNNSYLELLGVEGTTVSNTVIQDVLEQQVTLATEPPFDGIALSSGVGGDDTGHNQQVKIARQPYSASNLVINGDFSNGLNGWTIYSSDMIELSVVDDNGAKALKAVYIGASNVEQVGQLIKTIINHKYYISGYVKGVASNVLTDDPVGIFFESDLSTEVLATELSYTRISDIKTITSYSDWYWGFGRLYLLNRGKTEDGQHVNNIYYWKDIKVYDLTEMFGAGIEPTKEWCDENL